MKRNLKKENKIKYDTAAQQQIRTVAAVKFIDRDIFILHRFYLYKFSFIYMLFVIFTINHYTLFEFYYLPICTKRKHVNIVYPGTYTYTNLNLNYLYISISMYNSILIVIIRTDRLHRIYLNKYLTFINMLSDIFTINHYTLTEFYYLLICTIHKHVNIVYFVTHIYTNLNYLYISFVIPSHPITGIHIHIYLHAYRI